jgi:hypothetical protein
MDQGDVKRPSEVLERSGNAEPKTGHNIGALPQAPSHTVCRVPRHNDASRLAGAERVCHARRSLSSLLPKTESAEHPRASF